jgi:GNAT superfamily N-acetyltransferase
MHHPIRFRVATLDDVPAVVDLVESAYRGDRGRKGWTTESDILDGQRTDEEEVRGLVEDPGSVMLLAFDGPRLVACCHLAREGTSAYFGMFSVDPFRQNGGLGRAVLAEAERVARDELGCDEMTMTVITVREELLSWYERRGYSRTGAFKPFPYGNARFGVPKRDDLRFEVLVKRLLGGSPRKGT